MVYRSHIVWTYILNCRKLSTSIYQTSAGTDRRENITYNYNKLQHTHSQPWHDTHHPIFSVRIQDMWIQYMGVNMLRSGIEDCTRVPLCLVYLCLYCCNTVTWAVIASRNNGPASSLVAKSWVSKSVLHGTLYQHYVRSLVAWHVIQLVMGATVMHTKHACTHIHCYILGCGGRSCRVKPKTG